MRSVIDQNVVMRCMPVCKPHNVTLKTLHFSCTLYLFTYTALTLGLFKGDSVCCDIGTEFSGILCTIQTKFRLQSIGSGVVMSLCCTCNIKVYCGSILHTNMQSPVRQHLRLQPSLPYDMKTHQKQALFIFYAHRPMTRVHDQRRWDGARRTGHSSEGWLMRWLELHQKVLFYIIWIVRCDGNGSHYWVWVRILIAQHHAIQRRLRDVNILDYLILEQSNYHKELYNSHSSHLAFTDNTL